MCQNATFHLQFTYIPKHQVSFRISLHAKMPSFVHSLLTSQNTKFPLEFPYMPKCHLSFTVYLQAKTPNFLWNLLIQWRCTDLHLKLSRKFTNFLYKDLIRKFYQNLNYNAHLVKYTDTRNVNFLPVIYIYIYTCYTCICNCSHVYSGDYNCTHVVLIMTI